MISSTGSSIPMDTLRISPVDICGRPHILRQSSADGPRRRPSLLLFGYAMQLRIKLYDLILAFANALDQVHPALTGHHSVATVLGYFRAESALHNQAARMMDEE